MTAVNKKNILLLAAFGACYFFHAVKFNHYYTPDTIYYISVAEHLRGGDFYSAINAYWSPLMSWLLAPLMLVYNDGIIWFKIINALLGIFILVKIYKILDLYKVKERIQFVFLLALCFLVPLYCVLYLTPDVLAAALLLQYYYLLLTDKLYGKPLLLALAGFVLYLAKAYCLYFFVIHILVYFILSKKNKSLLPSLVKGLALLAVLCAVWAGVLAYKYNSFTLSTSGRYNRAIITKQAQLQHPCDTLQMIAPGPKERYAAWEEMSRHVKSSITENWLTPANIGHNIASASRLFYATPRYGVWLFTIPLLLLLIRRKGNTVLLLPLSAGLIYLAGYLVLFIEERYLVFSTIVLVLLQAVILNLLDVKNKYLLYGALLVYFYSITRPVADTYFSFSQKSETVSHSISSQTKTWHHNNNYVTYHPYQFQILAYLNKWKNFSGIKNYGADSFLLETDLRKYSINFILIPDTVQLPRNIQQQFTDMRLQNIDIYQLWKRN